MERFDLDAAVRKVPDFPKPGIRYYDITSVLMNPAAFAYCVDEMVARYRGIELDAIAAVESRGFLFATPLALALRVPVILVRKAGKLPGATLRKTYDLEYGSDTVEVHVSDLTDAGRILIVDDLIATGGTVRAIADLIRDAGGVPVEVFSVIGLRFLNYADALAPVPVHTLIDYDSE